MRKIKILAYLAVIVTILYACKATVEGEQRNFDSVKSEISELSGLFPRYTSLLTAYLEELDSKWAIALETSDEDAKISALKRVNSSAKIGKVKPLFDLMKELKSLEDNITFIEGRNAAEVEISVLREIDGAYKALNDVKGKISGDPIADVNQASIEINGFIAQIKDAGKYVAMAVKRIKDKEAAEKEAQAKAAKEAKEDSKAQNDTTDSYSSSQSQTTTTAAPVKEEVKMVKCKYCKTSNPETNSKCKSCGAAL